MISFRRVCLRHSLAQALASTRHSTRKDDRENIFRKISFEIRKLEQSLVSRNKIFQSEKLTQKISLSLSFSLFLWFWAFRETQQCTCSHDKQSASLYIRQDSTLTCLHSHTQAHAHCIRLLQSESHALSPSAWTSVQRRQEVHAWCAWCAEYTHAQCGRKRARGWVGGGT